jgi:hypothetical protein
MATGTAPLTKAQRTLLQEAQAIADLTKLDISDLEEIDNQFRLVHLRMAINRMVVAEIVIRYTLIDEILSDLIARYYFKVPKKSIHFQKLWRTKKFSTFTHHILDEIFLIKKMALIHAIKPLPKDVTSAIHRVNTIRNPSSPGGSPQLTDIQEAARTLGQKVVTLNASSDAELDVTLRSVGCNRTR